MGLVASIASLVQLTGQITIMGYGYLNGAKRARGDRRALVKELESFSHVLVTLQDYIRDNTSSAQSTTLQKLSSQDGPLRDCAQDFEELKSQLKPRDGFGGVIDSSKWPLKETETLQHIAQIERYKSLFTLALGVDHM